MKAEELYDCIVIGGGPAGLNGAVVLGRCRRKVLLFDTERYRNEASHGMHNYLTRDDILPSEFLSICQKELQKYSVQRLVRRITMGKKNASGIFEVKDQDGRIYRSKKLLVATGLSDTIPDIEGFAACYGKSIFHCPYCDGWEVRDKKIGVYARNKEGAELALALKCWTDDVTLYTDGGNKVKSTQKAYLEANAIDIVRDRISKLESSEGQVQKIIFNSGQSRDCDALFFVNGYSQQCNLAEAFGCEVNTKGVIVTNRVQKTNVEGLYVAGDAAKDMHFVVVAAGEGAKAAVMINKDLIKEEFMDKVKERNAK
jgi:thioredoxin reductase